MQELQSHEAVSGASLVEIVSEYTKLKKSGSEYVGLCPFHTETKPSFYVDPVSNVYYCFGCQEGGNIDSFLRKIGKPRLDESSPTQYALRVFSFLFNKYREKLHFLDPEIFNTETQRRYYYGYSNGNLLESLRKKFTDQEIFSTNLFKSVDTDLVELFKNRIVFPITRFGELKGFVGYNPELVPRYLTSPGLSYHLLGFDQAKRYPTVYLVEGLKDLLAFFQAGYPNVVSTLGARIKELDLYDLMRVFDEVIFAFDGDEAGIKGIERVLLKTTKFAKPIRVIKFPDGLDPYDLFKKAPEVFKEVVSQPLNVIDFLIEQKYPLEKALEIVAKFPESFIIENANYIASKFETNKEVILRIIDKYRPAEEQLGFNVDLEASLAAYSVQNNLGLSPLFFNNPQIKKALLEEDLIYLTRLKIMPVEWSEKLEITFKQMVDSHLLNYLLEINSPSIVIELLLARAVCREIL